MVSEYLSELLEVMPDFDPSRAAPPPPADFEWPRGWFVVLMEGEDAIACGAVRRLSPGVGELRRMWVRPPWRGKGAGRFLLEALEGVAREMGLSEVRLDTNEELAAALSLYRSAGYREVSQYNDNDFADYWLAKLFATSPSDSGSGLANQRIR